MRTNFQSQSDPERSATHRDNTLRLESESPEEFNFLRRLLDLLDAGQDIIDPRGYTVTIHVNGEEDYRANPAILAKVTTEGRIVLGIDFCQSTNGPVPDLGDD